MTIFAYEFMQRALLAALMIGACAPAVGSFLVQRRLSLIGDGLGHVALAGVAVGLLTGTAPLLTALLVAVVAAVAVELARASGRTGGDALIALMLYGGIAGAAVLAWGNSGNAGGGASIGSYLFGSITSTSTADVRGFAVLTVVVLVLTLGLARRLFAIGDDPAWSRAAGLPVRGLGVLLSVLTALTVVVSMRVVGLLMIGALLAIPVTTANLITGRFRAAMLLAIGLGMAVCVGGLVGSYYLDSPSGATIVLLAVGVYAVVAAARSAVERWPSRPVADAPGLAPEALPPVAQ
jgi:zinc transport system permease protein